MAEIGYIGSVHPGRVKNWAIALAALAVAWPVAAHADMHDIEQSDNAVSLDAGVTHFQYRETIGGTVPDSEKSWLPTVALTGRVLTADTAPGPLRNLYFELKQQATIGNATYIGSLQDGTPFDGTTDERIIDFTGRVGRGFELFSNTLLIPFGELGYRYWSRNLRGPGGYSEQYGNAEAMLGLMGQVSPVPRLVLSLEGAAGQTLKPAMTAGEPFNAAFDLGDALTWQAGGKLGYSITPSLEITGTAHYTELQYGASKVVETGVGPAFEPDSKTRETTLLMGIAYHFF